MVACQALGAACRTEAVRYRPPSHVVADDARIVDGQVFRIDVTAERLTDDMRRDGRRIAAPSQHAEQSSPRGRGTGEHRRVELLGNEFRGSTALGFVVDPLDGSFGNRAVNALAFQLGTQCGTAQPTIAMLDRDERLRERRVVDQTGRVEPIEHTLGRINRDTPLLQLRGKFRA